MKARPTRIATTKSQKKRKKGKQVKKVKKSKKKTEPSWQKTTSRCSRSHLENEKNARGSSLHVGPSSTRPGPATAVGGCSSYSMAAASASSLFSRSQHSIVDCWRPDYCRLCKITRPCSGHVLSHSACGPSAVFTAACLLVAIGRLASQSISLAHP